jgi:hypothetical protein
MLPPILCIAGGLVLLLLLLLRNPNQSHPFLLLLC